MEQKTWTSKKGKSIKFLKVKDLEAGDFTGVFVETYQGGGKYKSLNHKFLATEDITIGEHTIKSGDMVVIGGCGSLNNQMEDVLQGEETRVSFGGKTVMKSGNFKGSEAFLVDVLTSDAPLVPKSELSDYIYSEDSAN